MYILGIIGYPGNDCHDASAALYHNGKIVASAEQERFSRRKHAYGEAPYEAIKFCLQKGNISLDDIDEIAVSWELENVPNQIEAGVDSEVSLKLFPKCLFDYNKIPRINFINHHLTHLASAFYQSGYQEAACLIVDGQGEEESITLAYIDKEKVEILKKYPVCYSLGAFYDAAAGYTGLGYDVPGKLMGLAPYGIINQKMPVDFNVETGEFILDLPNVQEKETGFLEVREKYLNYFLQNNFPYNIAPFARVETGELMSYVNFAASVQECLENLIYKLALYLKNKTGSDNLVMAGGVTLNCTANGKLDRAKLYNNIFVYPAANDAGCSVGAALEMARRRGEFKDCIPRQIENVYLGNDYSDEEIEVILRNHSLKVEYLPEECFAKYVAHLLAEDKIVAWFQRGFEFGPRALGARSILANPAKREMLNRVNRAKNRELWRPLSPIVLDTYYEDVFEDDNKHNLSKFMLKTCKIRKSWLQQIPAVVHIDGTSRPQYLNKENNEKLYSVLEEFFNSTKIPLLINTSFNTKRQPIVNTPIEAITSLENNFYIDALIIGNWCVRRLDNYVSDLL